MVWAEIVKESQEASFVMTPTLGELPRLELHNLKLSSTNMRRRDGYPQVKKYWEGELKSVSIY